MDRHTAPQQRDMVYCHRCENEWYRDEHGLICPECESEFTEIIEANHDPRAADSPMPSIEEIGSGQRDFYAPDPDEDDISRFEWHNNRPGQTPDQHFHGTFARSFGQPGSQDGQPLGPQPGGIFGMLSSMFGNGLQQQQQQQQQQQEQHGWQSPPPQQQQQQQQQYQQEQHQQGSGWRYQGIGSVPGSAPGHFVRHTSGPGYSITFTSSTNNLHPRSANSPQPFQHHPENIEQLLGQMFMNIGAVPGHGGAHPHPGAPIFMGIGGPQRGFGGTRAGPGDGGFSFGDLLSVLLPQGGVHGDAVYSQDAFDRVITQLMEQHQTGNAPGPATEDAISSLPSRPIVAADQGDNGKAECSICMDEAELGATVTTLPCDHWFHHECIKAWLSEHDTCPHCRRGIMPKDEPNTSRPRQPSQAPLHDMHSPEYHLPRTPGEFPFGQQDAAGEGSGTGTGTGSSARSPGGGAGMFSRMREAFGGGGSGSGSNTRRGSDNNRPR